MRWQNSPSLFFLLNLYLLYKSSVLRMISFLLSQNHLFYRNTRYFLLQTLLKSCTFYPFWHFRSRPLPTQLLRLRFNIWSDITLKLITSRLHDGICSRSIDTSPSPLVAFFYATRPDLFKSIICQHLYVFIRLRLDLRNTNISVCKA